MCIRKANLPAVLFALTLFLSPLSAHASAAPPGGWSERINDTFATAVDYLAGVLLCQIPLGQSGSIPLIVLVLVLGGVFFTLRFGFINMRMFRHSIDVIRGRYDRPSDAGEVSHFQALTSALSATVGLGNIASVAVAIAVGGPGAVFWMWVIAFFGMSMKFASCSLAQIYRRVRADGSVLGGPMVYLEEGIRDRFPGWAPLGKSMAVLFAAVTVLAALGGGNMFQGNQTYSMLDRQFGIGQGNAWVVGLVLGVLVGVVIIGGIRRIGEVTSRLVPLMCGFYCLACLVIMGMHYSAIPSVFASIVAGAWSPAAGFGGLIGVLVTGATRAAFSNEAGLGSAAIAHSAAKTDEPIREGVVAMIGPFIDTIVVCTMTAITILVTGAHLDPASGLAYGLGEAQPEGVQVTAAAFESLGAIVPHFLCVAVFVFAYSTMISWSYYGEKAMEYLFGPDAITPYRIVYLMCVMLGPVLSLQNVLAFSDMMLLSMSLPNIAGMVLLSGVVAGRAKKYVAQHESDGSRASRSDWSGTSLTTVEEWSRV